MENYIVSLLFSFYHYFITYFFIFLISIQVLCFRSPSTPYLVLCFMLLFLIIIQLFCFDVLHVFVIICVIIIIIIIHVRTVILIVLYSCSFQVSMLPCCLSHSQHTLLFISLILFIIHYYTFTSALVLKHNKNNRNLTRGML